MKLNIYILLFFCLFIHRVGFSQVDIKEQHTKVDTSAAFFNYAYWNGFADKQHLTPSERAAFIAQQKQNYIYEQRHQHASHSNEEYVWLKEEVQQKGYGSASTNTAGMACVDVDFESGTFNNWIRSTGYNPANGTPPACCPQTNGDQTIMSNTSATDPYGGFPIVFPGGSFSARLGSTANGGRADRLSQTFLVTSTTSNFTYRYAMVLNDGGHQPGQQPYFVARILDASNNPISCTTYSAEAGSGTFTLSALTSTSAGGQGSPVYWKNWTNVAVDLTSQVGNNVTMEFTVYDCYASAHWAYVYLDGLCTKFDFLTQDTICPNVPTTLCAPTGFSTTIWNGPGVINDPNRCISVATAGTFVCNTILPTGCTGPTFTHVVTALPNPVISFTPVSTACSLNYQFNSSQSISSGSIISSVWDFGDGSSSNLANPTHTYAAAGFYNVKFKATSNRGCSDSVIIPINIFPKPNLAFSPPSNCINTSVQFTNTSSISLGSITGYTWNLGNGNTSNLVNPSSTYTSSGTYTITLTGISNNGCSSSLTQTLGIFPPPVISFSASPLCDVNGTSFAPSTSTAIVSGSLASFFWDFGDNTTSNQSNPVHIYNTPGTYVINFSAISNHNCPASTSQTLTISPSPSVAFATTSVNACAPNFTFTNNSSIAAGSVSYVWHIGASTTTVSSPSFTFPGIGNYTVELIGTSNLGCGDTARQYISIYPYPVINFSVPASCENAIFSVSTTAVSGSVTSYNWDFGDPASGAANTSTLQNPTHFYSTTNNYTITLNLMSNLNCPSQTITPITVFPNPVASMLKTTANNCSTVYNFTNASTTSTIGASALTSYFWDFGAAGTSTTTASSFSLNFPGNGTYSVSLIAKTNHNCSDTVHTVILVHPKPVLDFTLMPTCQNIPASIPSSTFISTIPSTTASIVSYTWDLGDNTYSNTPTTPPHTYANSGTFNVVYSGTSDMGCITNVSKTQTVYPLAVIDFTVPEVCLGSPTNFTSTQSVSSGTIFTLNWNFGDGSTGYNPNPSHTYTAIGAYPVTYTASTHNECNTVLTKTAMVNPLPVISFTANGGCLNVLSNFTESCTISPFNSSAISSYTYFFGDGSSLNAQTAAHTYTAHGTYHPTLTATTNKGCAKSGTINLVIDPLPNIVFGPPSGCENTLIQFSNSSNIALGAISSYTWDFGNGSTSNLLNPTTTYTYDPLGPYTVSLSATSNLGCVKTGTNLLAVNPYPILNIWPVNNSCKTDTAHFNTNVSIPGGSIPSYTISFGDGGVSTFTNALSSYFVPHAYNAYGNFTVNLNATSAAGCASSANTVITVYAKPFVNYTFSNTCYGDLTVFTNSCSIPTGSIDSYIWYFNNGANPYSYLTNPTNVFLTSPDNTYSIIPVSLTAISHPEGTLQVNPLSCSLTVVKNVTIFPIPIPTFSTNNACFSKSTNFSNSTALTSTAQTINGYSWSFFNNGQVNSILTNPSFVFPSAGIQTVQLVAINSYGCSNDTIQNVTVYNNPASAYTTTDVCLGNSVLFTNTTPPPLDGNDSTSVWTIGATTIATTKDASYSFTSAGTFSVSLTSISTLGCSNKYTSTVTVYPLPNIVVSANEACHRSVTQFTNLSTINPGSISSYNWDFGDPSSGASNTSTLSAPGHVYLTSGNYTAIVTALSDKNCSATSATSIIVRKTPSANFNHTLICTGDKINFTNISSSSDGAIKRNLWDFNGDNIYDIDDPAPSYIYNNPGNYNVKLVVITEFGCGDTMTRLVYVNPKAKPEFTSDNKTGCPPVCINFVNQTSISDGTPFTTVWDFGDGSPNSDLPNPSHCFNAGLFDVGITVTSNVGCISKYKQPGYVSIYPLPEAKFSVYPPEVDEEDPLIEVTGEMGTDVEQVRYYINDGSTYSTKNFSHYIKNLKSTKPLVVLIAKNKYGCADTTSKVLEIKPAFMIYFPNVFTPNGDGNNDVFMPKGVGILKFSIQIYDRWGHKVFTSNDITDMWDGRVKENDGAIKEDVYTWKSQVTDIFNKTHNYVGHVTIIR